MSIAIVHVERGRALVAVDTVSSIGLETPKMVAMPFANYVLAFRGVNALFSVALCIAHQNMLNVDGIEERHADLLKEAHRRTAEGIQGIPMEGQLIVAGWSERAKTMKATVYTIGQDGAIRVDPINDYVIAGAEAAWGPPPFSNPGTHDAMEQVARWQVGHWRRTWPDKACGGRLQIAELTPRGVTIRTQCELG